MRPPPMGVGYAYAVPGHIGNLRGEAVRRRQAVDVKEKVNYTGGCSKSTILSIVRFWGGKIRNQLEK